MTLQRQNLPIVMDMHDQGKDVVHEAKVLHYRWSSIHVISIDQYTDIPGKIWRGKVINVSVGVDSKGSFGANGTTWSSDCSLSVTHSRDVLKCSVGGGGNRGS